MCCKILRKTPGQCSHQPYLQGLYEGSDRLFNNLRERKTTSYLNDRTLLSRYLNKQLIGAVPLLCLNFLTYWQGAMLGPSARENLIAIGKNILESNDPELPACLIGIRLTLLSMIAFSAFNYSYYLFIVLGYLTRAVCCRLGTIR